MRGIVIDPDSGQPIIKEVPAPTPAPQEVLVSVKAASVNRADLWQKMGHYPLPKEVSQVLGLDFAGEIIALGEDVKHHKVGERVMGIVVAGGQGEQLTLHEDLVIPIPQDFSYEEAAAIPEVFITAFQSLKWNGQLDAGQHVLIHAGACGVGSACIQTARELGAKVLVTAGSHQKCAFCLDLGAEEAILYHDEEFSGRILEKTEGKGCEIIVDVAGASFFEQNLHALAKGGTIVLLSTLGGNIVKNFDLAQLMGKWARVVGTTLRFRSFEYKRKLVQEFSTFALPLFAKERLKPIIHKILPWNEIQKAHSILEHNEAIGKIVLKII